ncbi:MAG: type II secretion system F family protein [Coprococcus sp.]
MLWFLFGGMILCVVLLPVFLAERWCRRHKQKKYFPVPRGMGWLQRTAVWMLYHLPESVRQSSLLKGCADMAAGKLSPGIRREVFCQKHKIKKIMIFYGGLLLTAVFLMIFGLMNRTPDLTDYRIQREDARGSSHQVAVEAEIEGLEEKQELLLTVRPRRYSEEERDALIEQVKDYIDRVLPGENDSLQEVSSPLYFPCGFPDENVSIEWQLKDYNLIHQDGTLGNLTLYQLPVDTVVTAIICYDNFSVQYEKNIRIIGREKTAQENLTDRFMEAVEEADERTAGNLQFQLPNEVDGHKIIWSYHRESTLPVLAMLAVSMIVCLVFYQEEKLKQQMRQRTEQLLYDYPGFVHRMVLMLGAGMTVRRSWDQLIIDYEKEEEKKKSGTWLYKEMKYARIQMQTGIPEIQAYMDFGRRTDLPQYIKFSQLLIQHIRRGSRGMQEMMLQEASEAEKQRRDLARRLGETAGTKLLLPMMMLMVIVLVIVMVPAFFSM